MTASADLLGAAAVAGTGRTVVTGRLLSPRGRALLGYLPEYYRGAALCRLVTAETDPARAAALEQELLAELARTPGVLAALCQAWGSELDLARAAFDSLLTQAYVTTAEWGLDTWEAELGLPTVPGLDAAARRARLIAKLRGLGIMNAYRLLLMAAAYATGQGVWIEDFPHYTVTLRFVAADTTDQALQALQPVLRELVPAHLALRFEFSSRIQIRGQVSAVIVGERIAREDTDLRRIRGHAQLTAQAVARRFAQAALSSQARLTALVPADPIVGGGTLPTTFAE